MRVRPEQRDIGPGDGFDGLLDPVLRGGDHYCRTVDVGSPLIFAPATDGILASSASWSGVTVVPLRAAPR